MTFGRVVIAAMIGGSVGTFIGNLVFSYFGW